MLISVLRKRDDYGTILILDIARVEGSLGHLFFKIFCVNAALEKQIVESSFAKVLFRYFKRLFRHLIGEMLVWFNPLTGIVSGLFEHYIHPVVLDGRPLPINIMAAFVFDRLQTVALHVASEYLIFILRRPGFKNEDARSNA